MRPPFPHHVGAAIALTLLLAACAADPAECDPPECSVDAGDGTSLDAGHDAADSAADAADAGDDAPPCLAETEVDPANCGACDNPCAPGQACTAGVCVCGPVAVLSFAQDIQPLFAPCASGMCHANSGGAFGLTLGPGKAYSSLVDVPTVQCRDGRTRVEPGDPSRSYLMDKLLGVRLCSGSDMPPSGALPAADIEKISAWICAGAQDD